MIEIRSGGPGQPDLISKGCKQVLESFLFIKSCCEHELTALKTTFFKLRQALKRVLLN